MKAEIGHYDVSFHPNAGWSGSVTRYDDGKTVQVGPYPTEEEVDAHAEAFLSRLEVLPNLSQDRRVRLPEQRGDRALAGDERQRASVAQHEAARTAPPLAA